MMVAEAPNTLGVRIANEVEYNEQRQKAEARHEWDDQVELLTDKPQEFTWTNDERVQVTVVASVDVIKKMIFELTLLAVFKSMQKEDIQSELVDYLGNLGKKLTDQELKIVVKKMVQLKNENEGVLLVQIMEPLISRRGQPFHQDMTDERNQDWLAEIGELMQELRQFTKQGWSNSCGFTRIWEKCSKFQKYWKKESDSQSFFLRYLAGSFMYNKGAVPVLEVRQAEIEVHLQPPGEDEKTTTIMGLGPSGCGKSYYAKQLFPKIKNVTTVVAIDGGISRKMSVVWLVASVLKPNHSFITDIDDVFSSVSKSKKELFEFLESKKVPASLYVPDTLTSAHLKNLFRSLDSYIAGYNYNQGDTVSMLIMQHCVECRIKCPFEEKYQCVGCDESGKNRQETEGKMYSASNYGSSLDLGYEYTEKATKAVFIHNSGKMATLVDGMPVGHSIIAYKPGTFQNTSPLPNTLFLEMKFPKTYPELEPILVKITQETMQTPAGFVNKKKLRAFLEAMTKHAPAAKGGRTRRKNLYS